MLCAYQISFSHSNSGAESLDFQRVTRSKALAIAAVMSGEGCKKAKNIDRFHCRRAGTFILLPSWPYTCVTLGNDHDRKPESGREKHRRRSELNGIVYDRACDLHSFVKRLSAEGNMEAQWMSTLQLNKLFAY